MPTDVIMPALGVAQETGKLLRWFRAEGEAVEKGEPLLEVETDKVTVEIEAAASGVLGGVTAAPGEEIPVGRVIGLILAPGEEAVAAPPPAPAAQPAPLESREPPRDGAAAARPRFRASPMARRLAAERNLDLAALAGSGPHGAIVAADVLAPAAPATPAEAVDGVGRIWRTMAERTTAAWTSVPHFFLVREVGAARLLAWRDAVRRRPGGGAVTITDLLIKVLAASLRDHPRANASWHDGGIVVHTEVNVGVATAVDDGLVVPVVHGADRLRLAELAARRAELVERARAGRLRPDDVQGATFTLSNLGMFGVDAFSAILVPPQAAILAVGRIVERVVPVAGVPAVAPVLVLTLACDHRTLDGARGAGFLEHLAALVEEPAALVD